MLPKNSSGSARNNLMMKARAVPISHLKVVAVLYAGREGREGVGHRKERQVALVDDVVQVKTVVPAHYPCTQKRESAAIGSDRSNHTWPE